MTALLLQLGLCAALIALAGYQLCLNAERLAARHGWGRGWVGLALLATVTSLPELASGLSAVTWVGAPDLAVGHALGACLMNLLFLALVDLLQRNPPLYAGAATTHALSAAFGGVMLACVALSLWLGAQAPALLHLGLYSPLLLLLYLAALRSSGADSPPAVVASNEHAALRFALSALVVLAAGSWLPSLAERLADLAGWRQGLVGTLLMALITTLPEMAVTLAALRLRALDLALGNLLGSNLFNLLILALDDLAYAAGPLLQVAAPSHLGTVLTALLMNALVLLGLLLKPRARVLRLVSWVSVGLVAVFGLNAALLYLPLRSEGGRESGVAERAVQSAAIKAQDAAVARATASTRNAECGALGVQSGHERFPLRLSGAG